MDLTQFFTSYWWLAVILLVFAGLMLRNIVRFFMTLVGLAVVFYVLWYFFFR